MEIYQIGTALIPGGGASGPRVAVLTTDELSGEMPGWIKEARLQSPRGARYCKAEIRRDHVALTIAAPPRRGNAAITFTCSVYPDALLFVDDGGTVCSYLHRIASERSWKEPGCGRLLYDVLELLIAGDARMLEEQEDKLVKLENSVLSGSLESFSRKLMLLRKELSHLYRYYNQLCGAICELEEDENSLFTQNELRLFRLCGHRAERLRDECQLLREYCIQVRELFQSENDLRQNRIMCILTIVTSVFMPLTLLTGWYGMNFKNMPELSWQYGYPAVIAAGAIIVILCLWICKKKKFW
ncbi:MAG: CorA family divalent cation transporter [Candidatus Heteroscillospira sp.]|jgi:magnesium transporter